MTMDITIPIDLDRARERITATYKKAIEALIDVGRMLKEVKDNLQDETTFHTFVETLPFSQRSAYYYLRLNEHYLNHGSAMVALEQINISVWYQLEPDSELVQKVIDRANEGKKVSKKDLKQLVGSIEYETVAQAEAWNNAVETSPHFVLESFKRGVVTNLDGHDIPIEDADATLVQVNSNQMLSESIYRQKIHIEDNSKKKRVSVDLIPEIIKDAKTGRLRMALPEHMPARLVKEFIRVYYDVIEVPVEKGAAA